jgi:hypothetical protein
MIKIREQLSSVVSRRFTFFYKYDSGFQNFVILPYRYKSTIFSTFLFLKSSSFLATMLPKQCKFSGIPVPDILGRRWDHILNISVQ